MRPQRIRRLITKYSALLVILVPTIISSIYYGLIASDQYAVEVRFAVRGFNTGISSDLMGIVTGGASSGSTTSDSYILMDYLRSRAFLEKLDTKVNVREIYGPTKADFLSSFPENEPVEELVNYWANKTSISYDTGSQIVVVEVKAFTREDALTVADALLNISEELVNDLSAKARSDAVRHAQNGVERMENRLRDSRRAVRNFREKEQVIDPSKSVESRLVLIARIEAEIAMAKASLSSQSQFLSEDAPRVKVITSKIKALEKQLSSEKALIAKKGQGEIDTNQALPGQLQDYREILMDQEFSEKAYVSALSSLETARADANSRQRYLAVFVSPSMPEMALYPKRLSNIILTLILSAMAWAIGTLIVYAVRDHMT